MFIPIKASALPGVLIVLALVNPTNAETLSGADIRQLVSGQKVYLSTPFGVELPLIYQSNGEVVGNISGISVARMFAPRETGKWWVQGNVLCQKWPTWYKGKQFCFSVRKIGVNKIAWLRDDGTAGTARIGG
ncbi:hypothetical protein [Phyllobacterium sp. P5_D12]